MRALAIVALALLLAGCGRPVPAGTTELLFASPYGPGHPFSKADRTWMKFVEERSDGRLKVRTNWSGGLIWLQTSTLVGSAASPSRVCPRWISFVLLQAPNPE